MVFAEAPATYCLYLARSTAAFRWYVMARRDAGPRGLGDALAIHWRRMLADRAFWNACIERASVDYASSFDILRCTSGS